MNETGMKEHNEMIWNVIDKYFAETPNSLVSHHLDSYNDFFKNDIYRIFQENNPLVLHSMEDPSIRNEDERYRRQCKMYFGGKSGEKIFFGKPTIQNKYLYPNEARIRNMDYSMTIHYDIDIEFISLDATAEPAMDDVAGVEVVEEDYIDNGGMEETKGGAPKRGTQKKGKRNLDPNMAQIFQQQTIPVNRGRVTEQITYSNVYLGRFPIMVQSDFCLLGGMPKELRYHYGECRNDIGGYFIIGGKERVVIPQEVFADNMLYIRSYANEFADENEGDNIASNPYLHSAEIRSVSENSSKPVRTFSIRMVAPTPEYTNKNIVVVIPNVRKPIPLFIVFRALGIISDKEIIRTCLLDLDKYQYLIDEFIPSVHDAGQIFTQRMAIQFIALFTKYNTEAYVHEILMDFFLPHIGENNFTQKAYYLGYMVFRLLSVSTGMENPTDRDNYKYKRLVMTGSLLYELFREYYNIQFKNIHLEFEKKLYYEMEKYKDNLRLLISENYAEVLSNRIVEEGFRKAFKGNWGAFSHTKRVGVIQPLDRISFNSSLWHLRKINLPIDASLKIAKPRYLHNSQWGFMDPIDTPDGGHIGLHKSLAIMTRVPRGYSREIIIQWLQKEYTIHLLENCTCADIAKMTKLFVNGYWLGCVQTPLALVEKMRLYKRNSLIPIYTSISFEPKNNVIYIYTDSGRMCRPIFYMKEHKGTPYISLYSIKKNYKDYEWKTLIHGFHKWREDVKEDSLFKRTFAMEELFLLKEGATADMGLLTNKQAVIEYIDNNEMENTMIAVNIEDFFARRSQIRFTHCEIHESLLFGFMVNQTTFPENNPLPRNSFSVSQSKQACSLYHTNYQVRMDKMAVVLNYGQMPLVKSRYTKYIHEDMNPYGVNAIVAIMCYTGYNVEDAILINQGAIDRGLFQVSYFTTYEDREEAAGDDDGNGAGGGGGGGFSSTESKRVFVQIETEKDILKTKEGYNYSKLNETGVIQEGEIVDDKTILIGSAVITTTIEGMQNMRTPNGGGGAVQKVSKKDASVKPKKGQTGFVDKTFITEDDRGNRIAKVRVCDQRKPNLGDKFASTVGQKGTIGMIIPEEDMPFTAYGVRPDMIINPHALPSRMTIGQLVSSVIGKSCVYFGGCADSTAFNQRGTKIDYFGRQLTETLTEAEMNNSHEDDSIFKYGFHSRGNEILYNGMTGEQIESEIFIGPTYYMRLKHMVKDKINYRCMGPRSALTRQAVGGRANDGGLRIGEMEKDAIIAHGMSNFLYDSMMERGDKFYLAICNQTGMIAVYNWSKNIFLSPALDGPLHFDTNALDRTPHLDMTEISRFGRSFSVVCVPYAFKLFLQELGTMNIQLRIITEDNIAQFESMKEKVDLDVNEFMNDISEKIKRMKYPQIDKSNYLYDQDAPQNTLHFADYMPQQQTPPPYPLPQPVSYAAPLPQPVSYAAPLPQPVSYAPPNQPVSYAPPPQPVSYGMTMYPPAPQSPQLADYLKNYPEMGSNTNSNSTTNSIPYANVSPAYSPSLSPPPPSQNIFNQQPLINETPISRQENEIKIKNTFDEPLIDESKENNTDSNETSKEDLLKKGGSNITVTKV